MKNALDILFKGSNLISFVIFGRFNIGSIGKIESNIVVMDME
jgi:hypothetical protein